MGECNKTPPYTLVSGGLRGCPWMGNVANSSLPLPWTLFTPGNSRSFKAKAPSSWEKSGGPGTRPGMVTGGALDKKPGGQSSGVAVRLQLEG